MSVSSRLGHCERGTESCGRPYVVASRLPKCVDVVCVVDGDNGDDDDGCCGSAMETDDALADVVDCMRVTTERNTLDLDAASDRYMVAADMLKDVHKRESHAGRRTRSQKK